MNNKLQLHLIEKCIKNDSQAQMQLYDLYCKAMFNIACNFIKDDVIAQDIMQEAFIKAFKKIKTYSGEATFGAWLKRIVINQSLDWLKKQKLETVDIDDHVISIVDDDNENWEVDTGIGLKAIYHCIEQLPIKCKNVVKLYLLEGYDHQEVAQILQISEIASRSQLSRGKNKLRELLTNRNYES
jgi:RNA polymerase sigma-70 factor (ECF subfamily)